MMVLLLLEELLMEVLPQLLVLEALYRQLSPQVEIFKVSQLWPLLHLSMVYQLPKQAQAI